MSLAITRLLRSLRRLRRNPERQRLGNALQVSPYRLLELQIRDLCDGILPGQDIFVFLPTAPWRGGDDARPQRFARALAAAGHVVLFDCSGTLSDGLGLQQIETGLFLFSGPTRLLATLPDPILWVTIDNAIHRQRFPSTCRVVYHWTENPDVLRRIHEEAMRAADAVVTTLPGIGESDQVIASGDVNDQARRLLERLRSTTRSAYGKAA